MPRLRGLDGDVGSLQIPDLSNHDDVGVLTQKRAQCCRKSQTCFFVDIDLVHAGQVDFRGVFCGRNIDTLAVEHIQAAVQRNGFSRPCRARHQDHAVGSANGAHEAAFLIHLVTQGLNAQLGH